PDRVQHRPSPRGDRLEPAQGSAPRPGRPHHPDISNQGNPANYLTRDTPAPSTKVMDSVIGGQRELADLWRHWLTPDGEPSPCPGALLRAHRSVLARLLPEH